MSNRTRTTIEFEITYKRKASATVGIGTYMFYSIAAKSDEMVEYYAMLVNESGEYGPLVQQSPVKGLIGSQILAIEDVLDPISSSDIFLIVRNTEISEHGLLRMGETYIKVAGAEALTCREFGKLFKKAFVPGYEQEDASLLVKLANVIIVFVAFILAVPTGGTSFTLAATINATAVLTLGLAIQGAFGMFLNAIGDLAGAVYTSKMTTFIGRVASFFGFAALIWSTITIATTGMVSKVINGVAEMVKATTMDILKMTTSWLNIGVDIYSNFVSARQEAKLKDKQALLDEQQEKNEDLTSPKAMLVIQEYFEGYWWAEVNAILDNMPYQMTQGKIDIATTKYY